jgi:hypothetical protein
MRTPAIVAAIRTRTPPYGYTACQSRDMDSPARSGAYAASLREANSVNSRTRFVLRVSSCVRSQSVPCMFRSVPGTLASRGSASPTKHGSVVGKKVAALPNWEGKTVIDATNAFGVLPEELGGLPSSAIIAKQP